MEIWGIDGTKKLVVGTWLGRARLEYQSTRALSASSLSAMLAQRLITSHASRDTAFAAFTSSLDDEERLGLLADFAARARRPDGAAAALLRALLASPALRLTAAREAVRLMHMEKLSGKSAVLCLSELRIAVLRYWECRGKALSSGYPGDETNRFGPHALQRLDDLLLLCEDLLAILLPADSTDAESGRGGSRANGAIGADDTPVSSSLPTSHHRPNRSGWGDGSLSAIQLLPTVMHAADAVHAELAPGEAEPSVDDPLAQSPLQLLSSAEAAREASTAAQEPPSAQLIARLLTTRWDVHCALPVLTALEDVAMTRAQRAALRARLDAFLIQPTERRGCSSSSSPTAAVAAHQQLVSSIRAQLLGIAKHILAHADRASLQAAGSRAVGSAAASEWRATRTHMASSALPTCVSPRQHVGSGGGDAALATDEASEWLALILRVASLILPAELPELLWLVESSLRHSPALRAALFGELRRSTVQLIMGGGTDGSSAQSGTHGAGGASVSGRGVSQLDATGDGSNERVDAIYAGHMARLAVLMLLLQRTAQPPALMDALQAHLGAAAAAIATATMPSGCESEVTFARNGWVALQRLLRGLVCMPALSSRTEAVLDLAYSLCEATNDPLGGALTATLGVFAAGSLCHDDTSAGEGRRNDSEYRSSYRDVTATLITARGRRNGSCSAPHAGGVLLLALFGSVAESRPQILSYMFDALAQEDTSASQRALWYVISLKSTDASTCTHLLVVPASAPCNMPTFTPLNPILPP